MQNFFNSLSIKIRLNVIIFVAVLAVITSQIVNLYELWVNLKHDKIEEVRLITETVYSIMEQQNRLVEKGDISLDEAKASAKQIISELRYGDNEYFFLFDKEYHMVMHPIKPSLEQGNQRNLTDSAGYPFFRNIVDGAVRNGHVLVEYVWDRKGNGEAVPKISYGQYYRPWGWGVSTGLYIDDLNEKMWQEVKYISLITVIILIPLFAITFLVSQSITEPLLKLKELMTNISAKKDLSLKAYAKGRNELSNIGHALNQMLDSFSSTLQQMQDASNSVANASVELSATTDQSLVSGNQQKEETFQVKQSINQLSENIKNIFCTTEYVAEASTNASNSSMEGQKIITQSRKSINDLSEKLSDVDSLTNKLEEQIENISSILSVISNIAEQTNLLALNAAIEAARAGDQGRGFAVVADEVRSLSSRTHDSTNEIKDLIEKLQSSSLASVKAVRDSLESAQQVEESSTQTENALNAINESVAQIQDMIQLVVSESKAQSAATEEITESIGQISVSAEQNVVGSQQTSAATEELARLATMMKDDVEKFQLA